MPRRYVAIRRMTQADLARRCRHEIGRLKQAPELAKIRLYKVFGPECQTLKHIEQILAGK